MDAMGSDIRVECDAGYRGEQEPRRFWLGARPIAVIEILDRWLSPDHRYFKLRAEDNDTYIVRHDTRADRWELTMFHSAQPTLRSSTLTIDNPP